MESPPSLIRSIEDFSARLHLIRFRRSFAPRHADHHGAGINGWIAVHVTGIVGTMWCAYAFVVLSFYGLPIAINGGAGAFVQWASSQFIQLVLLPIIIVGQNVQAKASDARSQQTFEDAEAILKSTIDLAEHLQAQDSMLQSIIEKTTKPNSADWR